MNKSNICELTELVMQLWSLTGVSLAPLDMGSADCFAVNSNEGGFFFKLYRDKFSREILERKVSVCKYLNKRGFSVSDFIADT